MKKYYLKELIRLITREILNEYEVSVSNEKSNTSDNDINSNNLNKTDSVMTDYEKRKLEREKRQEKINQLKQKKLELQTAKTRRQYQKQAVSQSTRYTIPRLTKDIQQLSKNK